MQEDGLSNELQHIEIRDDEGDGEEDYMEGMQTSENGSNIGRPDGSEAGSPAEDDQDEEDEHDLRAFGIYQALPVRGRPDYASGPPTTAEEYLRRVRHEAARLPDVVTSSIDPRTFDSRRTAYTEALSGSAIQEAPAFAKPSHEWVIGFLREFVGVRNDLLRMEASGGYERVRVPSEGDHGSWRTFCNGDGADAPPHQPTMPVLMAVDQVKCAYLLKWHVDWAKQSRTVSEHSATWLYAITARLQRPLTQGTMAALRSLLRHCAQLRAGVTSAEDPLLPNLNILIAISGAFFGQDEQLAGIWEHEEDDA